MDRYAYDSWGEPVSDDRPNEMVPQQLRYRGYYYDEALTYYWVDGRYDDPEAMRWLQPSAPNADDYAYARDNPIGANSQRGGPEPRVSASGAFPNFMGFVDLCPYFEAGPGEIVYSPFDPTDIPDAGGVRVVARRALGLCATFTLATLRPVPNVVSASGPNGVPILYNCEPKKPLQRFRPACDRAHLVAASLGGPGIPQNIVYTTVRANRSGFATIENRLRELIAEGYIVHYRVYAHYPNTTTLG